MTGSNSRSEFQLLSLMTKELLRKLLKYDDTISNGSVPAAMAYLAALHFAASEYRQATSLCSVIVADKTSQVGYKETLNARCLLFIDDVARIIGMSLLKKLITENNLDYIGRRIYLDLRI